jgi:hypothetical protein
MEQADSISSEHVYGVHQQPRESYDRAGVLRSVFQGEL